MVLRSEYGRLNSDDWIITNGRQEGELNELTETPHTASPVGLQVDLLLV